jgi:hypothetical protein
MSIRRGAPISLAALVHAVIDVVLLSYPWRIAGDLFIAVLAFPVSQNALVAIWSATHPSPSHVRCVVLSIGLVATWYVGVSLLPGQAASDPAAGWGAAFVVQSLVIVFMVALARYARQHVAVHEPVGARRQAHRYSLATLFLWTAALAVPLMFMRLGMTQLGWTARVFQWEFLPHLAIVGVYNGLYAVVVLMSIAAGGLIRRWMVPGLLLAALGFSKVPLLEFAFTDAGGLTISTALLFCGMQVLILYATLIPLRLIAKLAARQDGPSRRANPTLTPVRAEDVQICVHDERARP